MNKKLRFASLLAGVAILAAACGSGSATTAPESTAPESTAPESMAPESMAPESMAPSAEPLVGEITLWHSYGSGGGETGAFQKALGAILVANKDLKVNVVEQPFSDIFNKWNVDVAAGGGPDMFVAPNDSLFSQADAGVLLDLTTALEGQLEGFSPVAIDGSKVDGKFFMVPESLKAVALWYDKSAVPTAPATTDALLAGVKDGSIKLGINQDASTSTSAGPAPSAASSWTTPASASPTRVASPTRSSTSPTSRPRARRSTRTATPSSRTSRPGPSTRSSTGRGRPPTSRKALGEKPPSPRSRPARPAGLEPVDRH